MSKYRMPAPWHGVVGPEYTPLSLEKGDRSYRESLASMDGATLHSLGTIKFIDNSDLYEWASELIEDKDEA